MFVCRSPTTMLSTTAILARHADTASARKPRKTCHEMDTPRVNVTPSENNRGLSAQAASSRDFEEPGVFSTVTTEGRSLRCDPAQFSHSTFAARRLLPDKGKPTARWGRKATDQAMGLMAGLPKEGRTDSPGKWWSSGMKGRSLWYQAALFLSAVYDLVLAAA